MSLSHVLLGLLVRPGTGEELRTALTGELRHVWTAEASDVDATLALLESDGSVEGWSDPGSPRPARIFRRTPAGTQRLFAWLCSGPSAGYERTPAAAQMRFQWQLEDPKYPLHFLSQFREQLALLLDRAQRRELELAGAFSGGPAAMDPEHLHEYLSATHGTHLLRGQLAWCDLSAQLLQERARSAPPAPEDDLPPPARNLPSDT